MSDSRSRPLARLLDVIHEITEKHRISKADHLVMINRVLGDDKKLNLQAWRRRENGTVELSFEEAEAVLRSLGLRILLIDEDGRPSEHQLYPYSSFRRLPASKMEVSLLVEELREALRRSPPDQESGTSKIGGEG